MTVVLVEGVSDAVAVEVLASRWGLPAPEVRPVGGSKGARRAVESLPGRRLLGLVDAAERDDFEKVLDTVFVCDPDLEAELIRALGVDGVLDILRGQGELESFRKLQQQPFQRDRTIGHQLSRFLGGRAGNKERYARLFAEALPLDRLPAPLAGLLAGLGASHDDE